MTVLQSAFSQTKPTVVRIPFLIEAVNTQTQATWRFFKIVKYYVICVDSFFILVSSKMEYLFREQSFVLIAEAEDEDSHHMIGLGKIKSDT